jgi:hypothetical protein
MNAALTMHGFVRMDELRQAQANNRLRFIEESGLRVFEGASPTHDVFGFLDCEIARCGAGASLPDELRDALKAHRNRQIAHRGPPTTYGVSISRWRIAEHGVGFGNWLGLRNVPGGPRGIQLGRELGIVTNAEWKTPILRLLGIDLDRKRCVYEYVGEGRSG